MHIVDIKSKTITIFSCKKFSFHHHRKNALTQKNYAKNFCACYLFLFFNLIECIISMLMSIQAANQKVLKLKNKLLIFEHRCITSCDSKHKTFFCYSEF